MWLRCGDLVAKRIDTRGLIKVVGAAVLERFTTRVKISTIRIKPKEGRGLMLQRPPDRRHRHKMRVAAGRCCVTVEIDAEVVSWLARHRHLWSAKECYERDEIGAAISEMLRMSSRDC